MTQGLRINAISLSDFRSYSRYSLDDLGDLTIFVGRNAAGKTNILEAIQLLTAGQSFRHPHIAQLVRLGTASARISMTATDGNRLVETSLALEDGKKRFNVNGKPKSAADVRGVLPSVMFTPDDLELAKKSSSVRRDALDALGAQLNRNYYIVRRDYEKALRYKNRLLKEEASPLLVESIDETLVMCAAQLFCLRRALFERMVPHTARHYAEIAHEGEVFTARYVPSWEKLAGAPVDEPCGTRDEVRALLAAELSRWRGEERSRKRAFVGPHNDQVTFELAGRDVANFASQGQQRSVVLAWKLAEVALMRSILDASPVLLLDDVLSELDQSRREVLVGFVTADVQTFITATDVSGFSPSLLDRARIVQV